MLTPLSKVIVSDGALWSCDGGWFYSFLACLVWRITIICVSTFRAGRSNLMENAASKGRSSEMGVGVECWCSVCWKVSCQENNFKSNHNVCISKAVITCQMFWLPSKTLKGCIIVINEAIGQSHGQTLGKWVVNHHCLKMNSKETYVLIPANLIDNIYDELFYC